ncbi:MAG: hormogonium polysaccharide biosynthesis protein HpsL [Cyanobacteria bacterium P01_D01_bin.105]
MASRAAGKRSTQKSASKSKQRPTGSKRKKSKGKGQSKAQSQTRTTSGKKNSADDVSEELTPRQQRLLDRAAAAKRQEIISSISSIFFGCLFVGALFALLLEPKLGVAAGGALMCLILSFKYQRLALYAFIVYVPFAGTVIYALGGNPILQLAKDIFYIPALIGVYQFCKKNRLPIILPNAIKPSLIFLVIIVSITALVTNVPDQFAGGPGNSLPVIMALWGAKVIFGYIPLVACVYYLIRNTEDLIFLLRMQAVLVLIACSLAMMQYFMLRTGICAGTQGVGEDLFRASLDSRCFVGGSLLYAPSQGQIRLPGTFVAPWQWGWFLISGAFFSFGTTFSDKSPVWRAVGLISLIAVIIMALISGQRIALVLVPFSIALLTVLTGQVTNVKRFLPIGIALGLILTYLAFSNPEVIEARVESLISRWTASPPQQFMLEQFEQVWKEQEGIFGHGVGRATNSARKFGKTTLLETYHPKIIFEIGPLGLFAVLAMYTTLTVVTFKVYRNTRDKNLRSYAASMWVFIFFISYSPYYYPLDVDPVAVYYWLAAGVVLKIPELEKQEREKAKAIAREAAGEAPEPVSKRSKRAQPTFN